MSDQAKIKRYLQILQLIEKSKYPTIAEMLDRMSESGIMVSDRQLKRDIESLRSEFGLDIQFSVDKRGYCLENEEQTFPYFLKLLEFSQNMELLTSYLKEGSNIAEITEFEDYNSFKGVQYIRDIAIFIKDGSEIKLKYKPFDATTEKEYCFQPYLLREYLNRWYVIGLLSGSNETLISECPPNDMKLNEGSPDESGQAMRPLKNKLLSHEIRTFGLDRIVGIEDSGQKFKKDKMNNILSLFRNVIGINASELDIAEEIELVCNPFQGNLHKTLPIHASQKLISETATEIIFSYLLVVNFELKHRLLMMSTQAKVVKPQSLKDEMEKLLTEAQNFYKN